MSNNIASLHLTDEKIVETTTILEHLQQQRQKLLSTMDISDAIFLLNEGRKSKDCLKIDNVRVRSQITKLYLATLIYTSGDYKVGFVLNPSPVPLISEGAFHRETHGLYFTHNKIQTLGYTFTTSADNTSNAPELDDVCRKQGINLVVGDVGWITQSNNPALDVIYTRQFKTIEEIFNQINLYLRQNFPGKRIESLFEGISLFGSKNETKASGDRKKFLHKSASISLVDGKVHKSEGILGEIREVPPTPTYEPTTWYERAEDNYNDRKNFDHSDGDG